MSKKEEEKSQAERIIEKFGNARRLARLLQLVEPTKKWTPSSIYRWTYSERRGGRGGVIPAKNWPYIITAARLEGIVLTPEDIAPQLAIKK